MHGLLLLLTQSFNNYFINLPVGVRTVKGTQSRTLVASSGGGKKSPNYAYPFISIRYKVHHTICWWLVTGLTVQDFAFAHTRQTKAQDAMVDCPYCLSGGGSFANPTATITVNTVCNTPHTSSARNFLNQ